MGPERSRTLTPSNDAGTTGIYGYRAAVPDREDMQRLGLILPERLEPIPGDVPQTVVALWDRSLTATPGRPAVAGRYSRLTYAELETQVNSAAAALSRLGVRPGDRVAATMANHTELVTSFFAVMRLGAVWVGLNRALAGPEKAYMLADIGARVLLADERAHEQISGARPDLPDLDHLVDAEPSRTDNEWSLLVADAAGAERPGTEIDPFGPAAISFTSGTTGRPKGAVHSQHNMMVMAVRNDELARSRPNEPAVPRTGVCLPLTLLNLMILGPVVTAYRGGTTVLVDRLDPVGLAGWIRDESLTGMSLVPTILHDLLVHPDVDIDDLVGSFRPGVGGADCPPAWRQLFADHGLAASHGYGLTEAPTNVTVGIPDQPATSCGKALPHLRVVIIGDGTDDELPAGEPGEVCVAPVTAGPWAHVYTPMLGYWGKPEESAVALHGGLLHTGDVGRLDADGFLHLQDRKNDMIIRGGANIYPAEVERVLAEDPRVMGSAVIGIPDERLGERVVAAVQLHPGVTAPVEELLARCAGHLARYKVPTEILVVAELPRTEMGKVRRRDIRALFGISAPGPGGASRTTG